MPCCTQFPVILPDSRTERSRPGTLSSVPAPASKDKEVLCFNDASPDSNIPVLKSRRQNDARRKIIHQKTNLKTTDVFIVVRQTSRSGAQRRQNRSAANPDERHLDARIFDTTLRGTSLCRALIFGVVQDIMGIQAPKTETFRGKGEQQ